MQPRKRQLHGEARKRLRRVIQRRLVQRVQRSAPMLPARRSPLRLERRVLRPQQPSARQLLRREGSLLWRHDRLLRRARPTRRAPHRAMGMAEQRLLSSAHARRNQARVRDSTLLPERARRRLARDSTRLLARDRCPGPPVGEAQVIPVEHVRLGVLHHRRSVQRSAAPARSRRSQPDLCRFRRRSW